MSGIYGEQRFNANDRKTSYASMRSGRRQIVCSPTSGTGVTAQTSFVATTPYLIFYQEAGTYRVTLSGLTLNQTGTVAGGQIHGEIWIDPTNRYSSAGTAITPESANAAITRSTVTAGFTARHSATASATGASDSSPRKMGVFTIAASNTGTGTSIDIQDGVSIGATGSILIYLWAATTAPTCTFSVELIEETL